MSGQPPEALLVALRAQLAAVEKERDGHWRSFCRSEQERVDAEKERDKLKEENSRLWAEAGDSSAVQARKERDAATGALAAAMEVLRRVESDHADAEADMKAEWGKVDGGELYGHAWGYMTNAFNGVSAFLASPAADLTSAQGEVAVLRETAQAFVEAACARESRVPVSEAVTTALAHIRAALASTRASADAHDERVRREALEEVRQESRRLLNSEGSHLVDRVVESLIKEPSE